MRGGDEDPSSILVIDDDFDADDEVFVDANNDDEPFRALDTSVQSVNGSESVVAGTMTNANDSAMDGDDIESRHFQLPALMTGCNSPRKRPEVAKC